MTMERMTCLYEEPGFGLAGGFRTRIIMDNMTGVQYLVVGTGGCNGGVAITPLLFERAGGYALFQ
jgi:hypothetical protein